MNLLRWLKIKLNRFRHKSNERREVDKLVETINSNYTLYVANIYKERGYSVWEYNNKNINLILKKSRDIIFIQCRDNNSHIDIDDIREFKSEVDRFMGGNQIFKNYNIKLKYALSSFLFEESAYRYIKQNLEWIDYDIIKINRYS